MRINKYISDSGYCSRRKADEFIEQGRVTINGDDCLDFSAEVSASDKVQVDGETIKVAAKLIYIALNKPVGVTCTTDKSDPTNIVDFVGHKVRIFPIGRLDKASQGLILLTNDGDIVNKILRAGNAHQKEYVVTLERAFGDDFLEKMARGVKLDTGERTLPCEIRRESSDTFRIILTQGLNRQIRRMCESLHYFVKKLVRVRIMTITLKGIETGAWRYLTPAEVNTISEMTSESSKVEVRTKMAHSTTVKAATRKVTLQKASSEGRKPKIAPKKLSLQKKSTINTKNGNNSRPKKRNVH